VLGLLILAEAGAQPNGVAPSETLGDT